MNNPVRNKSARLFKIGDRVILGRHVDGENWNEDMDKYVGKEAIIVEPHRSLDYLDSFGYSLWHVDTNSWSWRDYNMALATNNGTEPVVNDFICHTCKNNRCSRTEKNCWLCGSPLHK